jgi:hypothetical protein
MEYLQSSILNSCALRGRKSTLFTPGVTSVPWPDLFLECSDLFTSKGKLYTCLLHTTHFCSSK